jgi:hypothetical protein
MVAARYDANGTTAPVLVVVSMLAMLGVTTYIGIIMASNDLDPTVTFVFVLNCLLLVVGYWWVLRAALKPRIHMQLSDEQLLVFSANAQGQEIPNTRVILPFSRFNLRAYVAEPALGCWRRFCLKCISCFFCWKPTFVQEMQSGSTLFSVLVSNKPGTRSLLLGIATPMWEVPLGVLSDLETRSLITAISSVTQGRADINMSAPEQAVEHLLNSGSLNGRVAAVLLGFSQLARSKLGFAAFLCCFAPVDVVWNPVNFSATYIIPLTLLLLMVSILTPVFTLNYINRDLPLKHEQSPRWATNPYHFIYRAQTSQNWLQKRRALEEGCTTIPPFELAGSSVHSEESQSCCFSRAMFGGRPFDSEKSANKGMYVMICCTVLCLLLAICALISDLWLTTASMLIAAVVNSIHVKRLHGLRAPLHEVGNWFISQDTEHKTESAVTNDEVPLIATSVHSLRVNSSAEHEQPFSYCNSQMNMSQMGWKPHRILLD